MKTKRTYLTSILVFASAFLLTGFQNDAGQSFSLKHLIPVVIEKRRKEIFQYWECEAKPFIWGISPGQVAELNSYTDSLEIEFGENIFWQAVQKEASQNKINDLPDSANGDLINAHLVRTGKVGTIRTINFLEAELLNYQLTRYPLLIHPTEFHAFILLHDSLNHIRVYFAASDQPWPPKPTVILEAINKDLKQGWKLKYHLHNHYEPKTDNYVGILAPSMADAQFFTFLSEAFNLDKALITNGFNTVEINSKEFTKFKSAVINEQGIN